MPEHSWALLLGLVFQFTLTARINSTKASNWDTSIFWLFCFSLFSANLLSFLYYSLRISKFLKCRFCTSILFRVLVSLANIGFNFFFLSQKSPEDLLSHWFLLDFLLGYSSFHPMPFKEHNFQAVRLILKSLPSLQDVGPWSPASSHSIAISVLYN